MFGFLTKRFTLKDYRTFLQRFEDIESRLRSIELTNDDFRDKVLRKIQKKRKVNIDEEEMLKTSGILTASQVQALKNGLTE